jgi:hypothetical protein
MSRVVGGKAGSQRVLAGTAAENKNSHALKELGRAAACLAAGGGRGLFR